MDPLGLNLTPRSIEKPKSYRDGSFSVLTFETDSIHFCYGVDAEGQLWDLCFVANKPMRLVHLDGKLTATQFAQAQELARELL